MELVSVRNDGIELGALKDIISLDVDIGNTNDFVLTVGAASWPLDVISKAAYWYADEYGELGGKIGCVKSTTGKKQVELKGYTWRGLLAQHVISPEEGDDYKIVSGEANEVLAGLIEPAFDGMFVVSDEVSQFLISKYQFKRYDTLLNGIITMLSSVGARLDIQYVPGSYREHTYNPGYVLVKAVPIVDYSDEIEFSQDGKIDFTAEDYRMGVNHLICLGRGELKDRQVVHLYADEDGNWGDTQHFFGIEEMEAVYDYSSAESLEDLVSYGLQRAKELGNYKSLQISLNTIEAQIGDIVGGQEQITGITLKKQIAEIIVKIDSKGKLSMTHKVGD